MTRFRVFPYKQGSQSAKTLAIKLNGKVLKHENSRFTPRVGDIVINWGSSSLPVFSNAIVLNPDVKLAQDKLTTFDVLHLVGGVNTPPHCVTKANAEQLGFPIVCRTKLTGHSGEGIIIANSPEELVDAPLYTKYIKKKHEYRLHVFRGNVFFAQRKAKKSGVTNPNWLVRNLEGGFAFVECAVENLHPSILEQATRAEEALGLDFVGVDVIWNEYEGKAYVLEVNTACGLEDRTAEKYAHAIRTVE